MLKRRKTWKDCIREKMYCNRKWNRKLMCLKHSMDEVKQILNPDGCRHE